MKTVNTLISDLGRLYDGLEKGNVKPGMAKEQNNAAGKMIAAAKSQLEYYSMRNRFGGLKVMPEVQFFEQAKGKA